MRIVKYFVVLVVTVITLAIALLSNVRFQSFLGDKAAAYLSEISGMRVKIERLNIGRLLSIDIDGLLVEDHHGVAMFDIGRLRIAGINYKPLSGAVAVGTVGVANGDVNLVQYLGENELNINVLINSFGSDTSSSPSGFKMPLIEVKRLEIERMKFRYQDENNSVDVRAMDYANIRASDIFVNARDIVIDGLNFDFRLERLSASERCGLIVNELSGDFSLSDKHLKIFGLRLLTPYSDLDCDIRFMYGHWRDYIKFITNVNMSVDVRRSRVNTLDIGRFAEAFYGFNNEIEIEATADGTVDDLCADVSGLRYGGETNFIGSVAIKGLPDINASVFNVNFHKFTFSSPDVMSISIGGGRRLDYLFKLPKSLDNVGALCLRGKFDGKIDDFKTVLSLESNKEGMVHIDGNMKIDDRGNSEYQAVIGAMNVDLGRDFGIKELGLSSFKIKVEGGGFDLNSLRLNADINFDNISVMDYSYDNVSVNGSYFNNLCNAVLSVDDDNLKLNLEGSIDIDGDNTITEFDLNVKKSVLSKLKLFKMANDSVDVSLVTKLRVRMIGVDVDKNVSFINIDSTLYSEGDKSLFMRKFALTTQMSDEQFKSLKLVSDYVNGELTGQVNFRELPAVVDNILDNTLFNVITKDSAKIKPYKEIQNFNFAFGLKNIEPVLKFFVPDLNVPNGMNIEGGLKSEDESLFVNCNLPLASYSGVNVIGMNMSLRTQLRDVLSLKIQTDSICVGDRAKPTVPLAKWGLGAFASKDIVDYRMDWFGNDTTNYVHGNVSLVESPKVSVSITDSYIAGVEYGVWRFNPQSQMSFDNGDIYIRKFNVSNGEDSFGIEGSLSRDENSKLRVVLDNFAVSNLDFLMGSVGSDFVGDMSGYFELMNPYGIPKIESNIKISNTVFKNERLGDVSIMLDYDRENELIELTVNSVVTDGSYKYSPVLIHGFYYPKGLDNGKKGDLGAFDITCKVQNFNISTLEVFLSSFLSDIKGLATGYFSLKGTFEDPDINGSIKLANTQFRVKFLNTLYSLSDEFKVDNKGLTFDNVKITDTLGRVALLNGSITHNKLKDFYIDLNVTPDNFAVLYTNRTSSSLFYGSASASGDISVVGPIDDISVSAKVRTTKGTDIYIPISSTSTIEDSYFVVFIDDGESNGGSQNEMASKTVPKDSGFSLGFDISVNPNTQISVIIPGSMGSLSVAGNGNVRMNLNKYGNFTLNGDYIVNNGTFILNLENIYGKQLDIKSGSKISFRGDPANATIDIATFYKTRTTLAGLNLADSTYNNVRTDVNAVIYLKNTLMNPEMWFSVEFPGIDSDKKQEIYSVLDTTNQALMTQQVLSLLLLNTFSMSSSSGLGSNLAGSSIALVTSQLNKLLSSFSKNVDIGFNYRPGDQSLAAEYELALSTNFFDNRLQVSGNFGYRQDDASVTAQNASQIIGDVLISYKLTKEGNVRVVAYNETNNPNLMTTSADYTQGVGISLSKSFNNIKELFTINKKSKEGKKKSKREIRKEAKKEDETTY